MCTEYQYSNRSHFVVGDVEFPEAREVRQSVQTSRRGSQSVTGEVELGQAGQVFQVFDPRYLCTPTDRGGGAVSSCVENNGPELSCGLEKVVLLGKPPSGESNKPNRQPYLSETCLRSIADQKKQEQSIVAVVTSPTGVHITQEAQVISYLL